MGLLRLTRTLNSETISWKDANVGFNITGVSDSKKKTKRRLVWIGRKKLSKKSVAENSQKI